MARLTQEEAVEVQKALFVLAIDILFEKREDYSGETDPYGNLRVAEAHGVPPAVGVNVRNNDKLVRVSQVIRAGTVSSGGSVGDKIMEEYRDVINYACIAAGLLAEEHSDMKAELFGHAQRFDEVMADFSKRGLNDFPF